LDVGSDEVTHPVLGLAEDVLRVGLDAVGVALQVHHSVGVLEIHGVVSGGKGRFSLSRVMNRQSEVGGQ
jgi:hypothetical protein